MKFEKNVIPYGKQLIDDEDIKMVVEVLQSDYLTTGPKVREFEEAVANFCGSEHAVAVSSGTAALHCAMYAAGIGPGDEVIVPPMTFVATANAVVFQGGIPVFADVEPETLLIDPENVEKRVTGKTRAIVAMDYAGHPCDYDALKEIASKHGLVLIADACHSLGAKYKGRRIGSLADMTIFSFHPVKHITTGEGGMIVTDDERFSKRLKQFRNHGISADHFQRAEKNTWKYEMTDLGFNYRITDIQCSLGLSQLKKLPLFLEKRTRIAKRYSEKLVSLVDIELLEVKDIVQHAYHLYVILLKSSRVSRTALFKRLRSQGIGVNVHYIPVHLHPFYREKFGTAEGLCPVAESAYQKILSLPIFPAMEMADVDRVVEALAEELEICSRKNNGVPLQGKVKDSIAKVAGVTEMP